MLVFCSRCSTAPVLRRIPGRYLRGVPVPEAASWSDRSAPYLAQVDIRRGDPWGAEAAARGNIGTHQILMAGQMPVPAEVAAGIEDPTAVLRGRLVSMDGKPVEVADS